MTRRSSAVLLAAALLLVPLAHAGGAVARPVTSLCRQDHGLGLRLQHAGRCGHALPAAPAARRGGGARAAARPGRSGGPPARRPHLRAPR